jgi:hypothetical protein
MVVRKPTLQGIAPPDSTPSRGSSRPPPSGVRRIATGGVPRPSATRADETNLLRLRPPEVPTRTSSSSRAQSAMDPHVSSATTSPIPSLVATSQNWPLVKLPVPTAPTFGIDFAKRSFHALPAFVLPRQETEDVRLDEAFDDCESLQLEEVDCEQTEAESDADAIARRTQLRRIVAVVVGLSVAMLLLAALLQ